MPDLKPCPFCGGTFVSHFYHADRGGMFGESWHVECLNDFCGNGTAHHETLEEAIAAWNTRHQPKENTDVMEFLRSAVALLDGALDSLGEAARLEARREAGKPMRSITHMHRYEAARKMVERGYAILGWEDAHD